MSRAKKLVLGIDGGGTKTDWRFVSRENGVETVIREGRLPGSNVKIVSDQRLEQILRELPSEATHIGVFLAGCGTDSERRRLRSIASRVWPTGHVKIGSDRDSGFATAFRGGDGIAVIAGTGSAVQGRKGDKREKAGGWGQLLGDRGSGYDLAMQGLRYCLRVHDFEQRTTPLARAILSSLSLNNLDELVTWVRDADKMSVARLAPVIFEIAASGDQSVKDIIDFGARRLAEYTRAIAQRLEVTAPTVKLLGGMFAHHPQYLSLYTAHLAPLIPEASVHLCTTSGAVGAVWLAGGRRDASATHEAGPPPPGTPDEFSAASTEQQNPRSRDLDRLSVEQLVDLFVSEEDHVTRALAGCRTALTQAVLTTTEALQSGGRLFYIGAGTSGRLGVLDASEIPPTFSAPATLVQGIIAGGLDALHRAVEGAEDQPESGALAIEERNVGARDVVCGIAASGRTPFVLGALQRAREKSARTILLTCNPARPKTATAWDVEIDLATGPELITGSTRLKAGTATKLALNIISSCTMIRLGKVIGNLMVDLNPSNEKLRHRAARMVSQLRGMSFEEAWSELEAHQWSVRDASQK